MEKATGVNNIVIINHGSITAYGFPTMFKET